MECEKNLLPLFPLDIVILPKEKVPLHIFEPRYKQLINDCLEQDLCFGIPYTQDIKVSNIGTKVKIDQILEEYPNGEMDIVVEGVELFCIIEFRKKIKEKLYGGGIILNYNIDCEIPCKTLFDFFLEFNKCHNEEFEEEDEIDICSITTLDIARNCCLSSHQKYQFLKLENENERQDFLLNQLKLNVIIKKQEANIEKNLYLN